MNFNPPPEIRALIEEDFRRKARENPERHVRIVDYLLVTGYYDDTSLTPAGWKGPVELVDGVRIEEIDGDLAERLMDAASPAGHDWAPTRQFRATQAFVRDVWEEDHGELPHGHFNWDQHRAIYRCVQLSRLVRDNNASTEYAVRRIERANGTDVLIPFDAPDGKTAVMLYPEERNWLDVTEAHELRQLATRFVDGGHLPTRVQQATRRIEQMTRESMIERALPLVVAAMEALLTLGHERVSQQFRQRAAQLAAEMDMELPLNDARDLYAARSAFEHGNAPSSQQALIPPFTVAAEVTRRAIRRAIEDANFAAIFEDAARIRERWPTTIQTDDGAEIVI